MSAVTPAPAFESKVQILDQQRTFGEIAISRCRIQPKSVARYVFSVIASVSAASRPRSRVARTWRAPSKMARSLAP